MKKVFVSIATVALLVQVAFPVWWGALVASIFYFWNEGIIEGGSLSSGSYRWGLFSVYAPLAFVVSIWSFISIKGLEPERILSNKKNVVFLGINILTIVLAVSFFVLNDGNFMPQM